MGPTTERTEPVEVVLPEHGVSVFESRHRAGFRMERRTDPFAKLAYVYGGEGNLVAAAGEPRALRREAIAVVPAGAPHRFVDAPGSPLALIVLCVSPELAGRRKGLLPVLFSSVTVARIPSLSHRISARLRGILYEEHARNHGWQEMQIGLCLDLLVRLARFSNLATEERPDARTRVRLYLRELPFVFFYPETLDEVARRLGLSRRRFSTLFREECGRSWLAEIQRRRIGHARKLLRDTRQSIPSIAFSSGFGDLSHFYRTFRQITGRTPAAERTRSKDDQERRR